MYSLGPGLPLPVVAHSCKGEPGYPDVHVHIYIHVYIRAKASFPHAHVRLRKAQSGS